MIGLWRHDVPVTIQGDGIELRKQSLGDMTVAFVQGRSGTDLRPALQGLPGNLCPCPHWGYVLKGTVRMHTQEGHHDYGAGQAFYWGPGHAPEIVDDAEYVDFSPTKAFEDVIQHITRQG